MGKKKGGGTPAQKAAVERLRQEDRQRWEQMEKTWVKYIGLSEDKTFQREFYDLLDRIVDFRQNPDYRVGEIKYDVQAGMIDIRMDFEHYCYREVWCFCFDRDHQTPGERIVSMPVREWAGMQDSLARVFPDLIPGLEFEGLDRLFSFVPTIRVRYDDGK